VSVTRKLAQYLSGLLKADVVATDTPSGAGGTMSSSDAAKVPLLDTSGGIAPGFLYAASATVNGIVTTAAQSFAGRKTFRSGVILGVGSPPLSLYYDDWTGILPGASTGTGLIADGSDPLYAFGPSITLFANNGVAGAKAIALSLGGPGGDAALGYNALELNTNAAGSGADWKLTLARPVSGMTAAWTLTLPPNAGTSGYVLQTDGSGNTSWVAQSGGSSTFASYTVLTASGGEDQINISNTPISGSLTIYKNGHLLTGWTLTSTTVPITPLAAGDVIVVDYLATSSTSASTLSTVNDIYFSFSSSRLTCDGTNASTTFTDATGKTWTGVGGAQLDTSIKQWGTASLSVTGGSDAITTPHHADFNFGPLDFTVEFWLYPQLINSTSYFFSNIPNAWNGSGLPTGTNLSWVCWTNTAVGEGDSKLCFSCAVGSTTYKMQDSVTIASLGTGWVKYAIVRDGATLRLYRGIAGTLTQVASTAIAGAINDNNDQVFVTGGNFSGGSIVGNHSACSHLDDIRTQKGVCRYPNGTSVAVESAALPTSGNGTPAPTANTYLPFVAVANSATLGRNTANLVSTDTVSALTLPHTALVDGDMVTFISEGTATPSYTITSVGPTIKTRAGDDTVLNCDLSCMQFTLTWKYPYWRLNL